MSERIDPDAAFARYCRSGEPAALADVFDATAAELLRVAVHLCRDAAAAEDLVQATFTAAIEGASGYDTRRRVFPWLVGILTHKASDLRRRRTPLLSDELSREAPSEVAAARGCELDDESSCPTSSPQRLTAEEVAAIGGIVTSTTYRHIPTGRLAVLAQRLGTGFASASTWYRLVRERGWRRPRLRIHPSGPKVGIRATKPNELWHIDATVIRVLDGTKTYVHAVIDNFSRRILAWRVHDRLDAGSSVQILVEAGEIIDPELTPKLLADAGSENRNAAVDQLIEAGLLERVLAMVDIYFSNSLIEAWWRVLKRNWLFLHPLDSVATVRNLAAFYVDEHNAKIPHSAFNGQTPDEIYFGRGDGVPDRLAAKRAGARADRVEKNRARQCAVCA